MSNVLVTGLPRSGLTSVCALIDYLPDSVCLNEPGWQLRFGEAPLDGRSYVQFIRDDFALRRRELLTETPIRDLRTPEGGVITDSIHDPNLHYNAEGRPIGVLFTKPGLTSKFTLGMKHHTLYTALLPDLVRSKDFIIIAVLRHPLDVILSWQRQRGNRPYMQGFIPDFLHAHWPEAARVSFMTAEITERMVHLYDMYCQRYYEARDHIHIVKYEDILKDPRRIGTILGAKKLSPGASLLQNRQQRRSLGDVEELRARIGRYSVFAKHFYPS